MQSLDLRLSCDPSAAGREAGGGQQVDVIAVIRQLKATWLSDVHGRDLAVSALHAAINLAPREHGRTTQLNGPRVPEGTCLVAMHGRRDEQVCPACLPPMSSAPASHVS